MDLRRVLCRYFFSGLCLAALKKPRSVTPETRNRLTRLEFRQRDSVAGVFENDFHGHVDVDFFDRATDHVAAEARTVVQIDPGRDIGDVRRETAQRLADDFANDREAKDFTFAADLNPFELVTGAIAANRPRAEDPGAAVPAFLHHQFAGFGALPERLVDRSDFGKWFLKYFVLFCHIKLQSCS